MVGLLVFKDPRVWDIWTEMVQNMVVDGVRKAGGPHGPTRPTVLSQAANLDSIPLPEDKFLPGALRIKMRDPLGQGRDFVRETLFGDELRDHYPLWNRVGKNDVISYVDDHEGWSFRADYMGLRSIMMTYPYDHASQLQKDLWAKMEEVLGNSETEGVWPYSLILATKRGQDDAEH